MTDYIYVRKCEFIGNDGETYYWFYQTDENGIMFNKKRLIPVIMSKQLDNLNFSVFKSKYSKVKFVKKDFIELMKLKRKSKVKERFKKFLKDEGVYYSYWMNFKNHDVNKRIFQPENYMLAAFCFTDDLFCSCETWLLMTKKWQNILNNEFELGESMFKFIKTDEGIDLSFNNKIYKPYEFSIVNNEIWIYVVGSTSKIWDIPSFWHETGVFIK